MRILCLSPLLLLAACGSATEPASSNADQPANIAAAIPAPRPSPSVAAKPQGKDHKNEAKGPRWTMAFTWPAAVDAEPVLRAYFAKQEAEDLAGVQEAAKDADAGLPGEMTMESERHVKVAANLPAFLSVTSEFYEFSGGAHGNSGFESVVLDRASNRIVKPIDFFVSATALRKATQAAFCDALDKQRAKKRGEPVQRSSEWSYDCIDPADQTIVLGSSNHQSFDRIGFLIAPYEAGPYAEGSFEVTLPVTAAILAAIKPERRAAFSLGR
jgi:hypothetical protein